MFVQLSRVGVAGMRLGRLWTRVAAVMVVMVTMTLQVPRVKVWRTDRCEYTRRREGDERMRGRARDEARN